MNYGLRYVGQFRDIDNNNVLVEIYKDGYSGDPDNILFDSEPLTITYEDGDERFKPVKYSGASIKLLTPQILTELYTGKIFDVFVQVWREGGVLIWQGYNSPNIYTQEYSTDRDATTLECIDCLSALRYLKYPNKNKQILTFLDLLKAVLAESFQPLPTIEYYNNLGDLGLDGFKCETVNWINKDDENARLNTVLEDVCSLLGVQAVQYEDKVLLIDFDYSGTVEGISYNEDGTIGTATIDLTTKNLNVAEDASNMSYGDIYNQINIIGKTIDVEDDVIKFDVSDNEHLEQINSYVYTKKVVNSEISDSYSELITMFCTRNDISQTYPSNFSESTYNPIYAPTSMSVPRYSVFERYAQLNYKSDIMSAADADTHKNITFGNNLTFKIDSNFECISEGTNVGEYSNLKRMSDNWDNSTDTLYSVLHYVSEPRKFSAGDWLVLSFNLNYSTAIGSGFGLMNPSVAPTIQNNTVTYQQEPTTFKNLVTGLIPFGIRTSIKLGNNYYHRTYNTSEWVNSLSYCDVCGKPVANGSSTDEDFTVINNNTYTNRCTSSTNGLAIQITTDYYGTLEFDVYNACLHPYNKSQVQALKDAGKIGSSYTSQIWEGSTQSDARINYVHISNLTIEHIPEATTSFWDITDAEKEKELKYNAVIDNNNVNEFSDLQLTLNTYNPDLYPKLSHSYIVDSNNSYITELSKGNYTCRPEEHLVRRYVNYYSTPKKIYTNTYSWNYSIKPIDIFTTNYLGENYSVGSVSIDVANNSITIKGYEI